MKVNPDVTLDPTGFGDHRHVHHVDLGAVQVADTMSGAMEMVLMLSGCMLGLAVAVLMIAGACQPRRPPVATNG